MMVSCPLQRATGQTRSLQNRTELADHTRGQSGATARLQQHSQESITFTRVHTYFQSLLAVTGTLSEHVRHKAAWLASGQWAVSKFHGGWLCCIQLCLSFPACNNQPSCCKLISQLAGNQQSAKLLLGELLVCLLLSDSLSRGCMGSFRKLVLHRVRPI